MRNKPKKKLEKCRLQLPREHPYYSDASFGMTGAFSIPLKLGAHKSFGRKLQVISHDPSTERFQHLEEANTGWEHVSVSTPEAQDAPTWAEMAAIRLMFWTEEETVMQLHVPGNEHVDLHTNCLHLWRPAPGSDAEIPRPPESLV